MPSHQWLLTNMFPDVNVTEVTWYAGETLPEPVPEWDEALAAWHWGWHVHTYGFGGVFFLLGVYAIVSIFEFRRRLKVQQYLLGINGILLLLGMSRAIYLFIDPYHSTARIPSGISQVLYGIAFPCLTSSFSLIQMVFMRITKVHMGPNKLQNYRVLAAIITSHFTIVIVIDITVAYRSNLKLLLLLCQSIFITWGLVLCFGFVYGGFKMTQFTNETQRVMKQLVAYNRVKQETLRNGNHRELALHRISKPKIRITDEENRTLSYGSDTSIMASSDTLSFYNDGHLDFEEETMVRAYKLGNFDRGYKKHDRNCDAHKKCPANSRLKSDSQGDLTSESDYVTDTPSTAGPQVDDFTSRIPKPSERTENFEEVDLMSQSVCSSTAAMLIEEADPPASFVNPALDLTSAHKQGSVIANGYVTNIEFQELRQDDVIPCETAEATSVAEVPQESGYMADTELNSPIRRKKRGKSKHKDHVEEDPEEQDPDNSSPVHQPYPLKTTDGTVSLYRIRQGRVLHKALRITYLTTLFGFICCILQLYAMFGVYGVLASDDPVDPWPWYIFHTFFRIFEFAMACSIAVTTYYFSRQRHRSGTRRKNVTLETQTKC